MYIVSNPRSRIKPQGFYVPETFDASAVVGSKLADHANYLVSLIRWKQIQWQGDEGGWVPLHATILCDNLTARHYYKVRQALVEAGVIEVRHRYVTTAKALALGIDPESKGFRIGPAFAGARTRRVECRNARLSSRLRELRTRAVRKLLPVHRHLLQNLAALSIDLAEAEAVIARLTDQDSHRAAALAIHHQDIDCTPCAYGRLHTNLTRLHRDLRKTLRFRGQPLTEIDIANSQPLFFALLMVMLKTTNSLRLSCLKMENFKRNGNPYCTSFSPYTLLPTSSPLPLPSIMFSTLVETQGSMGLTAKGDFTPDELCFLGLCEQGKLYEEMQAMVEDTPMRMPRAWFKEFFFGTVFFCPNRVHSPLQRMFKAMFTEEFPGVSRLIARLKRKDHTFLACLMQHYEACYMMAGVCPRLMKEHPEAPLLTIHDSVLTTEPWVETVEAVMMEEFARLGLRPLLRRKAPPTAA